MFIIVVDSGFCKGSEMVTGQELYTGLFIVVKR